MVKVHVAALDDGRWRSRQREVILDLARSDTVGRHHATPDPEDADLILFADLHIDDAAAGLPRRVREHALTRRWPEKIRVYDERDQPLFTAPGGYAAAARGQVRVRPMFGCPYPPNLVDRRVDADEDPSSPDLLFSFTGSRSAAVRDRVLGLRHPEGYLQDTSDIDFFDWGGSGEESARRAARAEFCRTIQRSRFVLCPRGHGPSSFRLYESMSLGRAPVIISDRWAPPPRVAWSEFAIVVPEARVRSIPALLADQAGTWRDRGAAALAAYDTHFSVGRWWDYLIDNMLDLSDGRSWAPRWAQVERARRLRRQLRTRIIDATP